MKVENKSAWIRTDPDERSDFEFSNEDDESRYRCICGWDETNPKSPSDSRLRSLRGHVGYANNRTGETGHMSEAEWNSKRTTKKVCARVEALIGVPRPVPSSGSGLAVAGLRSWAIRKWNDPEERIMTIGGFTAAIGAWPGLDSASPALWTVITGIFAVVILALGSSSKYLNSRPVLKRILKRKRKKARTRFGLNPTQMTVQTGVGLALGTMFSAINEALGLGLVETGAVDQFVRVLRLLVGA